MLLEGRLYTNSNYQFLIGSSTFAFLGSQCRQFVLE